MTNYSRTTLRELKKRYLNILKKCLLANLMAFSLALPVMSAETVDVTEADNIDSLLLAGNRINILDDLEIDLISSGNPYTSQVHDQQGGSIYNKGFLNVYGDVVFQNNLTEPYVSVLSNRKEAVFHGKASFLNNESGTNDSMGVVVYNVAKLTFKDEVLFKGNKAKKNYGGFVNGWDPSVIAVFESDSFFIENESIGKAAALSNEGGILDFKGNVLFEKNKSNYQAGALFNTGIINFSKDKTVKFIGNASESSGGAILNYTGGIINFNGITIFENNKTSGWGGAVHASFANGALNFNGTTIFKNNNGYGAGAISSAGGMDGKIFFNGSVSFINNYSEDGAGGLRTGLSAVFNSDFTFASNYGKFSDDIFSDGFIYISPTEGKIGTIEGGILNAGTIYKDGLGILVLGDQSINKDIYANRQGKFIQTNGLTISSSHNLELAEVHTINGGELKTHGAEIGYKAVVGQNIDAETGEVLGTGRVMHMTTKQEMEVNAETLANITFAGEGMGATIGVGTYNKTEQEKEIALVGDRLIEYLDDKGTEDTSDDEMVRYQATDKLFTIDTLADDTRTKFKVTGALDNEEGNVIAFRNGIVEIDESIGKTGATYELDQSVLESTTVQNKVLSKNMILGEAQEYSFTELEVAKGTTLDVKNKKVNSEILTMNENSVLNIDLNALSDHGKMSIGEVKDAEKGVLSLKLTKGLDQESGIYQVFDKDNELGLIENNLFNIKDLENGAYEVSKKTTKDLMKDFGLTRTQGAVTMALMEGDSSNESFSKMQSEILAGLQSTDKAQVQKAKKALKAVGKSEQPSSQSIAAGHFNELTRVISQMAMEKEAEVGRSGGEETPRAKVYIKGLYDKTKSTMGDGFKARSTGAVLGVQSEVTESLTLGVGYATSQTTAKEDLRRTEVDTNTGFISAHYQPNAWWVSGLATFSRGEYEEEKQILSSMGKATYDVDSWGAQVMTGYDIKLENAIITPEVGLRYLSVKQEGYTDTLGTTVSGTQSDYLTALVGVKSTWDMGAIRPTAGVTVGYDIISDDVSALNTLANGASYTVNGEALDRLSTTVTTGIEADLGDRTTLKLEYSGTFRKEYQDHSGMLKLEMRF